MDTIIRYVSKGEQDAKAHEYVRKMGPCAIVEETGIEGTRHYHAAVRTIVEPDTIRKWFNRNGWGERSEKAVVRKAFNLAYLCKGPEAVSDIKKPQYPGARVFPIVVENTLGMNIGELHESWWRQAAEWVSKKTVAKACRDEAEKKSLRSLMEEWYVSNEGSLKEMRYDVRLRAMIRQAVKFNAVGLKWGQYDIQRVVEGLFARMQDGEDAMVDEIEHRIRKNI